MREFHRLPIKCNSCKANIYNWIGFLPHRNIDPKNDIPANWPEPPRHMEPCPRCQKSVDTSSSYPYLSDFPPSFELLKEAYAGFTPQWESNRDSFDGTMQKWLETQELEQLLTTVNRDEGPRWFKQRMFYRSATAFYRSLQLFLAYLTLDRRCYRTWSQVTAYYSRFYFLQAFLNLCGCTCLNVPVESKGTINALIFFDGKCVQHRLVSKLPKAFGKASHEIWWSMMEAFKSPQYPIEHLPLILSRLVFNPDQRNRVNYSFDYLVGGFNELDWFDSGASQMLSHFMPHPRQDEDITDIDRFFEGTNPEDADVGDFYGDEAQIIWCSLLGYLQFVNSLDFAQSFIKTETIVALCDLHIGADYPVLIQGIAQSVDGCLQDGFDLKAFMHHYQSSPHPESLTAQWLLNRGQFYPKSR
jgi:hypothetical protein